MKHRFFALLIAVALFSCKEEHKGMSDGLYAEIETAKGTITVELEYKKAPVTVANFVSLAEGKNDFVAPQFKGKKFYDGLKFHRVLANFMIQGGDPQGDGTGDAGYKFKDEITDLKHDKPGILSMANSGPGTNSSQFFITHVPTPWLDGKHTIFGHVVSGQDVVNAIAQDDVIESVKIVRVGESAKKFDDVKTFADFFSREAAKRKGKLEEFAALHQKAAKTASGLEYVIVSKGNDGKPAQGDNVAMNYAGFLENGVLFDSNMADVVKQYGTFDANREAQGGYNPVPFKYGTQMIPGFTEGLSLMSYGDKAVFFIPSNLGYGAQGTGNGIIPPNSNLVFQVELVRLPANKQ